MAQTQWLLIGGEGHGKTLWIKGGTSVTYPKKRGFENQHYEGCRYLHNGKEFQLGLHNPTDDERAQVSALIVETKLAPIGDV